MSQQIKTKYAETLNALCAMQVAPNYETRRSVLIAAEEAIVSLERELAGKQAHIDRLMLEFTPDEMTPEQVAAWAERQAPVDSVLRLEINAAKEK